VSTFASSASPSTDQRLQKCFHLSHPNKIELKKISSPSQNKKYATSQTNTIQTMIGKLNNDNGLQRWTDRRPTGNSTYPKVAVKWLNQALCFYENFCLVDSEVLRNRHLRVAAKRCANFFENIAI